MNSLENKTMFDYRKQLMRSRNSLFEDEGKKRILSALLAHYPSMKTAYTLGWVPEQGESIYTILVDMDDVVTVELDCINKERMPSVKAMSINQYRKKLKKNDRIKLSVALDLAQSFFS